MRYGVVLGGRWRSPSCCATVLLAACVAAFTTISSADDELKSKDWDVIIFTQHWPATVCFEWKGKGASHVCSFPSQKETWTVHGIWPTKLGSKGPNFCDHKWKFDPQQIQSIEPQMEQYWINIEKDTPLYSLWDHEWSKHGTCAAILPAMNNELKYFAQGIKWLQLHSMTDVLSKAGISPNNSVLLNPNDLYSALQNELGKRPSLHCVADSHTGHSYLFEIRICFNKQLELIDCDGVKEGGIFSLKNLNHCDPSKPIMYPSIVPQLEQNVPWELPVVEIYKLITWLRWFTL